MSTYGSRLAEKAHEPGKAMRWLWLSLLLLFVDQASKYLASTMLAHGESVPAAADYTPRMQVQHRCQVMPAALRPDVGDVATPDLIGRFGRELAIQAIWNIWSFNRGLLVGVRARLLANQAQLTHQPAYTKPTNFHAILAQHAQDAPATGRASTLTEQLVDLAT